MQKIQAQRIHYLRKILKIALYTTTIIFALIGFFLSASYVAIQLKLTNDSGAVDNNSRYFNQLNQKRADKKTQYNSIDRLDVLNRLVLLNKYYPLNAQQILTVYQKDTNEIAALKMLDAIDLQLKSNPLYRAEIKKYRQYKMTYWRHMNRSSAYAWMNMEEWAIFKEAVSKDKRLIDSVSNQTGVEGRIIVSCLVGEQIRLFNSNREAFKKWIGPLKILSVESQFSFGVTGIKEHTAIQIEKYLKDKASVYYLGEKYESLLDFMGTDTIKERIDRLTSFKNHYYSYLYAAIFLKQVKKQWEKAGFPIDDRPEILATLFNVGFPQSKPKKYPKVGGSTIKIKDIPYSFGAIAFQFYYSGELYDLFPYRTKKFDWNETT